MALDPFSKWSADMAYALGLFFADGSLSSSGRYVQFYNTDKASVDWWHQFVGGTNEIYVRSDDRVNPLYASKFTSPVIGSSLMRLGAMPRKSFVDHPFPKMTDTFLPHFIRGYFDGDGGVWLGASKKSPGGRMLKVSLTSNAPTFRAGLKTHIVGIVGTSGKVLEDGIHLRLSGAVAEKFLLWIYAPHGQHMVRKQLVWDQWCSLRESYGGLISQSDPYEPLRGLRPEPWHSLCYTQTVSEVVKAARVSRSRVYQVRVTLGIKEVRCGA